MLLEPARRSEIAEVAGKAVAHFVSDPENLAGLAGALLVPIIVFRAARVPLPLVFAAAFAGDQMFRFGYRAGKDLHDMAAMARDARAN